MFLGKIGAKAYRVFIKVLEVFLAVLGAALVITVVCNVVARYVFHNSIPWSEELSRFTFIWSICIGAVLANDRCEHMQLDFVVKALPKKLGNLFSKIALLIVIILLAMLVKGGIDYSISQWDWKTSALHCRAGMVYIIAPVSFFIMQVQFVVKFIKEIIADKHSA